MLQEIALNVLSWILSLLLIATFMALIVPAGAAALCVVALLQGQYLVSAIALAGAVAAFGLIRALWAGMEWLSDWAYNA